MSARVRTRLALVLLAALASACDGAPGRPQRADAYVRPADVTDFATLYAEHCAGCHGADGAHGAAMPLANPVFLAWAPREAIRLAVSHGRPGTPMPAFARAQGGWLTDAQVDVLTDGLKAHWGGAFTSATPLPPYAGAGGDAARGAGAWATFCARCHGAAGQGGEGGSAVAEPDYLALVSDQALRTAIVAGRPDLEMPDWRTAGDVPMTDAQIADVVAWLAARRPAR